MLTPACLVMTDAVLRLEIIAVARDVDRAETHLVLAIGQLTPQDLAKRNSQASFDTIRGMSEKLRECIRKKKSAQRKIGKQKLGTRQPAQAIPATEAPANVQRAINRVTKHTQLAEAQLLLAIDLLPDVIAAE